MSTNNFCLIHGVAFIHIFLFQGIAFYLLYNGPKQGPNYGQGLIHGVYNMCSKTSDCQYKVEVSTLCNITR